jgi:6-phosphogluconolactonase
MTSASRVAVALFLSIACCAVGRATPPPNKVLVFVGTYTRGESKGIYPFHFDPANGKLTPAGPPTASEEPSFLAFHPTGKYLYVVNELGSFDGKKSGAVSAFEIVDNSGKLKLLNQQPSAGAAPCHLVLDNAGRNVLVANYTGGNVASLPIDQQGRLGPPSSIIQHAGSSVHARQQGPHAHAIVLDAAGRRAFAADAGIDKVLIYDFDGQAGKLAPHDPAFAPLKPGAGPRHFAFHPSGKFAYANNELDSTVTAFTYDAKHGSLKTIHSLSTLPKDFKGNNSTAEIAIHPSGKFLYVSNRGHDSIAIYAIDEETGKLSHTGHESIRGKTPRNFAIDPTGAYLIAAGQNSNTLAVFRIDRQTGELEFTGQTVEVPMPVCIVMRLAP